MPAEVHGRCHRDRRGRRHLAWTLDIMGGLWPGVQVRVSSLARRSRRSK